MIKPTEIRYIKKTHTLSLTFEDGLSANLTAEYLRCFSPSAEVKGHGPGQEVLQKGKENVGVDDIEPVGNYAVKLTFDDGHNTGLYSWEYLYDLSKNYQQYWHDYLEKLSSDGYVRKKPEEIAKICEAINPKNEKGKITLISRYGHKNVEKFLPKLIRGIKKEIGRASCRERV